MTCLSVKRRQVFDRKKVCIGDLFSMSLKENIVCAKFCYKTGEILRRNLYLLKVAFGEETQPKKNKKTDLTKQIDININLK
jgi:hypothetical protein